MPKIMVRFEFVNKEGKKRQVRFPLDRQCYEAFYDSSVSKEWRDRMLLDSYREYCAQKKYERMTCQFPVDDEGNEIEFSDDESQSPIEIYERKEKIEFIFNALDTMSKMQREAFILVHLKGYSQRKACKKMRIRPPSFAKLLQRAEKIFEIYLKKKEFSATSATNGNFWGSNQPI